jgi:hypothetical protein
MIPKSEIYRAVRTFCKDCHGDSPNDNICKNMECFRECELFPYRKKAPRQGSDGIMLGVFRKSEIRRRIKSHCRRICLNGHHSIREMCVSFECQLRCIAVTEKDTAHDDIADSGTLE